MNTQETAPVATKYEIMFIISPLLTEDKRTKVVSEFEDLLKSKNGSVFHVDDWGKRDIAYPIKKATEGYYMIYYFTLPNRADINEIDVHLRLEQGFLRHLIIRRENSFEVKDFSKEEGVKIQRNNEKRKPPKMIEAVTAKIASTPSKPVTEIDDEIDGKDKKMEDLDKKLADIMSNTDIEI